MGARPTTEVRRFRELAAQPIDHAVFQELLEDQWEQVDEDAYQITVDGVVEILDEPENRAFFSDTERKVFEEWREKTTLRFPCAPEEFVAWVDLVDAVFLLPQEFLEAVSATASTCHGKDAAERLLLTFTEDEPESEQYADIESKQYDGFQGVLPEWVPAPNRKRFIEYRDRLLRWGITVEQVRCCLDDSENEEFASFPAETSDGEPVDSTLSEEMISYLALLRHCVHLGPKKGLEHLAGDYAVRGYNNQQVNKNGADRKNRRSKEARLFCLKSAQQIWEREKKRGEQTTRIGHMCSILLPSELKRKGYFIPSGKDTISDWLKEAAKEGRLDIPLEAQRPGRPKK